MEWLKKLRALCDKHDILMIVDDIQVGCGRTGSFFSFERADLQPDIITLSKSISGCGLPLAVVLLRPELDKWSPGEHNGTFRGNQLAFVSGAAALEMWPKLDIEGQVREKSRLLEQGARELIERFDNRLALRGMGMIWGIDFSCVDDPDLIERILATCFENGLILENCGRKGQVMKFLPPLVASESELKEGLDIIRDAMQKHY